MRNSKEANVAEARRAAEAEKAGEAQGWHVGSSAAHGASYFIINIKGRYFGREGTQSDIL